MDWEALGAIGEIAGAAGVIITLVYLAKQIHESNLAARQAAMQGMLDLNSHLLGQIIHSTSISEIYIRGSNDDQSLSVAEKFQYRTFISQMSLGWERAYHLNNSGKVDAWAWREVEEAILAVSRSPGFQSWFTDTRDRLSDEWQSYISGIIEDIGASDNYRPQGIRQVD